jgi:hypothetical protein
MFLLVFSQEPGNLAFHILTNAQNFYAMKYWFAQNSFNKAALHVINYEAFVFKKLPKYSIRELYLQEEFRFLIRSTKQPTENTRMEYLSLFSHSHFLIPKIFKHLKKVVVLDDDVVVQHDLSFLWNIDMGDKVNGAVEFCGLKLGQMRNLLDKRAYDPRSCAWMSGVNLINLDKWREHNITENYLLLMKKVCTVRSQLISCYIMHKMCAFTLDNLLFFFFCQITSWEELFCAVRMWFELLGWNALHSVECFVLSCFSVFCQFCTLICVPSNCCMKYLSLLFFSILSMLYFDLLPLAFKIFLRYNCDK